MLSWPLAHAVTQLLHLLITDRYSFSPCFFFFFFGNEMFVLVLQNCLWWFCIGVIDRTNLVLLPVGVQCWVHALSGRWSAFLLVCVLLQVWWIPEIPAETFASAPEANTPTPTTAKPAVWSLPTAVSISGLCCFCPDLLGMRSLYLLLNNSRKWLWNFLQFRLCTKL